MSYSRQVAITNTSLRGAKVSVGSISAHRAIIAQHSRREVIALSFQAGSLYCKQPYPSIWYLVTRVKPQYRFSSRKVKPDQRHLLPYSMR